MNYSPYPRYKRSGVEWLGDVPEHWEVKRLKYLPSINDEALPETTDPNFEFDYVEIGKVEAVEGIVSTEVMEFESAPSRARRLARDGDTIVSTVRTYLRAIAAVRAPPENLVVSTGFAVIRPRALEPAFLSYALRANHFIEQVVVRSVGVGYPAVNASDVGDIPIAVPSASEQGTIADFLDAQTVMMRVDVKPELLCWARERAGLDKGALLRRFPHLDEWERGAEGLTLRQLEEFAKATHAPIGYLFLDAPPVEDVPIPDFRRIGGSEISRPSPDLLHMIDVCQQRQEWYRDYARSSGEGPLAFVGSVRIEDDIVSTAAGIREALDFDLDERRQIPTWREALRRFIQHADGLGVLVMCSGVGSDTRAAQMFTLAHELAHIWLGQSALSDAQASSVLKNNVERWCNRVAAEFLAPLAVVREEYQEGGDLRAEMVRLGRVGKRFASALVASTLAGQTLYIDAFRMLGLSKLATFQELGRSLGVPS